MAMSGFLNKEACTRAGFEARCAPLTLIRSHLRKGNTMGNGRKFNKTSMTRPIKSASARAQRHRQQQARLVALGVDEEIVAKLNVKEVREMLKRPAKIDTGV